MSRSVHQVRVSDLCGDHHPESVTESVLSSAASGTVQPPAQSVEDLYDLSLIGRQNGGNFVGELAGFRALAEIPAHLLARLATLLPET